MNKLLSQSARSRAANLNNLRRDFFARLPENPLASPYSAFSFAVGLPADKVLSMLLLDEPINDAIAAKIEESLFMPPGWLDQGQTPQA